MLKTDLATFDFNEVQIEQYIHKSKEYLRQYPALIELGKRTDSLSSVALALAVYGWMPRILRSDNLSEADIPAIRNAEALNSEIVINSMPTRGLINNSWVGTSKFLHFVNPNVFPIWDSHIARAFGLVKRAEFEKKSAYVEYTHNMHATVSIHTSVISLVKSRIFTQFGYEPSDLRCLEFLIFAHSQHTKS